MAGSKKFSWFAGVFTPSILTILGVIMYLRMGYVVGNSGLWGALLVVGIAHIISLTTGFSISSVATDKKVGAGGVYYVLSRSLGLPIGGAIGLTLFVGTALSIALYLIGFAEIVNFYFEKDWNLSLIASIALLSLTVLAFISTSLAIKSQYIILAAIVLSLFAIFLGSGESNPDAISAFGEIGGASFEDVFAVFFPAVTGFTAGIALSGDLKNPKKAIPIGTLSAIFVGLFVYIALTIFLAYKVDSSVLRGNYYVMLDIALDSRAVIAGVWGATLSSALGGILGGPRILQAMSLDKITPKIFGKGIGSNNEPRNALILVVIIAQLGILIGELDTIARVVSMFYLAAYGFINISFFLESWASTDFNPSFKVNKWVGMLGFLATFIVMFRLDMAAMFAAILIIMGIYFWLAKKSIGLGTGDVWQSVWTMIVKRGLHKMERSSDHKRNWKTNMLLFSGNTNERPYLLEFSKSVAGRAGMVTNFDLIENENASVLFPKNKEKSNDPDLERLGFFGRQMEVQNIFKGIETIATTFGFSGIEPDTVLMGWQKNTKDPIWFAQMTKKLIELDYNVLYLDYDKRWGFKDFKTIDIWWRGISNNGELMLSLARFLSNSPDWRNADIRVLFVNNFDTDYRVIKAGIDEELKGFRVQAEIKIINNKHDGKEIYELMKLHSSTTDLVLIDIPDIEKGSEGIFVEKTNSLVEFIGTTLLVKASSKFDETFISFDRSFDITISDKSEENLAPVSIVGIDVLDDKIKELDTRLHSSTSILVQNGIKPVSQLYTHFLSEFEESVTNYFDHIAKHPSLELVFRTYTSLIDQLNLRLQRIPNKQIEPTSQVFQADLDVYFSDRKEILKDAPRTIKIGADLHKASKIQWRQNLIELIQVDMVDQLYQVWCDFSIENYKVLKGLSDTIQSQIGKLVDAIEMADTEMVQGEIKRVKLESIEELKQLQFQASALETATAEKLYKLDRNICNTLALRVQDVEQPSKSLESKIEQKEHQRKNEFIRTFPTHWKRNLTLFHNQIEADLKLNVVINRLNAIRKQVEVHLHESYFSVVKKNLDQLALAMDHVREKLSSGSANTIELSDFALEENLYFSPENITAILKNKASEISSLLPSEIEVMHSESLNNFGSSQGGEILSENLVLDKITDYIIETKYIEPLKSDLFNTCDQLHHINNEIYHTMDQLLQEFSKKDPKAPIPSNLDSFDVAFKKIESEVEQADKASRDKLKYDYQTAVAELDIQPLIKEAEALEQFINKENRRKGLHKIYNQAKESVQHGLVRIDEFFDKKDKEETYKEFIQKHKEVENINTRMSQFIYGIEIKYNIEKNIPFYYKQLFSGKHLHLNENTATSRRREIEEVEIAFRKKQKGIHGALLISSDSLGGKSFFIEEVIKTFVPSKTIYINGPEGGSSDPHVLIKTIQKAFQSKDRVESILSRNYDETNIVFEDIELWWKKEDQEHRALNYIIQLVQKFGSSHQFYLSCNLYAYKNIIRSVNIEKVLLSSILLSPLSMKELMAAVLLRHKMGNLKFTYKGTLEDDLSERKVIQLMDSLYEASHGNIGLAFRLWLSGINELTQNRISISDFEEPEFPNMERKGWKVVLYQLVLHRSMTKSQFMKLFADEGHKWIENLIATMVNSGIIEESGNQSFQIHRTSAPFVEQWLYNQNILN